MKSATIVPALLIAVAGLFSPSIAEASCQNICVQALRACLASDWPEDDCRAEHAECLAACAGGSTIAGPQPAVESHGAAQSCIAEHGENTAPQALLALVLDLGYRADVPASQTR